jgi:uncharacterized protein (TIGR03067 family)
MNAAIRFPLTVIMILAAGTIRADDAANKAELEKLQGKWKLVSVLSHGQEDECSGTILAFEKDSATIGESDPAKCTIRLDCSTNPKLLDFVVPPTDAGAKSRVVEGVYTLDGDTLLWCFNFDGDQPAKANRPAAVESKADNSAVLHRFKRIRD